MKTFIKCITGTLIAFMLMLAGCDTSKVTRTEELSPDKTLNHSKIMSTNQTGVHNHMVTNEYEIIDLGTLGGDFSVAMDINSSGQVVGRSGTSSGATHAFIWDKSTGMRNLGTLGGAFSDALGINDAEQVVGISQVSTGESHAFIWDESQGMRDLGSLGGVPVYAWYLNEIGQVVGWSRNSGGNDRAYLWNQTDGISDLGTLGGNRSYGYSINEVGTCSRHR